MQGRDHDNRVIDGNTDQTHGADTCHEAEGVAVQPDREQPEPRRQYGNRCDSGC